MFPWMSPRSSCEIMRVTAPLLEDDAIQTVSAWFPGGAFEVCRLHARDERVERRLKIGRALALVRRRELRELLLEIETLQLHCQRLVRRSVEKERRLDLAAFDVIDEGDDVRHPIEADAVLQD